MRTHNWLQESVLWVAALFCFALPCSYAASFTWKLGNTAPSSWSDNKNWNPGSGPPSSSDTAIFGSAGSTTVTVDVDSAITGISFNSAAQSYTFGGGFALTIGGNGITNSSSTLQTFNNSLILGAAQTWDVASAGVTVNGAISGGGNLTKRGTGTLTLSGNNTYTGSTTVNEGTLLVNGSTSLGSTAGVQLNAGILSLGANLSFTTPPPLTLNGGTLKINDRSATFGALLLGGNSAIELNSSTSPSASVTFASASITGNPTLTITGWAEAADRDKIFITGSASSSFLAAVNFTGFNSGARLSGTELVPVPEPAATSLAVAALLCAAAFWRHRSKRDQCLNQGLGISAAE
jgi:autotransporter-associated beta strand protein